MYPNAVRMAAQRGEQLLTTLETGLLLLSPTLDPWAGETMMTVKINLKEFSKFWMLPSRGLACLKKTFRR